MLCLSIHPVNLSHRLQWHIWRRRLMFGVSGFVLLILTKMVWNLAVVLPMNREKPIDAIFVLGGSIRREIYASDLAKRYPHLPILISGGSDTPCVLRIFEVKNAPITHTMMERCARSTFDNFFYGVPLLRRKNVHKVKIITSPSHLPRAKYLTMIHLGTQGIAWEIAVVEGISGNHEFFLKTTLDVIRSLIWSFFAQFIEPSCPKVILLNEVKEKGGLKQGYRCERQLLINLD